VQKRFASVLTLFLGALVLITPLIAAEPSPNAATSPTDDQFKRQLTDFFAHAATLSPTALGNLSQDPQAMAGLRSRIDALTPEDLAVIQNAFAQVPDWQQAPEALSSAFQMQVLGEEAARRAKDLDGFRVDVSEFYAALALLPADTLQRLNQDPASVAAMRRKVHDMPDQSLALLQLSLDRQGDWRGLKDKLVGSLSMGARASLRALADNGPLGENDLRDLGAFRKDLGTFLDNLKRLPPEAGAKIAPASIRAIETQLARATPEMLFLIRQRLDTPDLRRSMASAGLLAQASSLSDADRADLQRFRADLASVYASLGDFSPGGPSAAPLANRVASMSDAELLLARDRIERIPSWKTTLPLVFGVVSTPEGRTGLALAQQGPAPQDQQALEAFRAQAQTALAALQGSPGVDPAAAQEAQQSIAKASDEQLYLMQKAIALAPAADAAQTLVDVPRAVATLVTFHPESVSFNCSCPDHGLDLPLGIGCISLQFLCNIVAAPINLALDGINSVVGALQTAVTAIQGVIDDVASGVQSIIQDIANLPNILLNALQSLFESIANAALSAFSPANIAQALGLVDGFWNSIPTLPQIPCPPDGFNLAGFGEVGDDLTASKYQRYLFIFDKVLDLIPDTEVSLTLKIPAQVLYGGIQYLGVCLDDAATARSEAATAAYRTLVSDRLTQALANQATAQTGINVIQTQAAALQSQVAAQGQNLMTQLTQQQQALLQELMQQGQSLTELIGRTGQDLTGTLHDFQDQDLRLKIEANLANPALQEVAFFELPKAVGGELELVRQIVVETIQATLDAGLGVHNAEKLLTQGDAFYAAGDYKSAYNSYAGAYRETTKNN
jgi:hypothetical protein